MAYEKLEMNRDGQDLKLFCFTVQRGQMLVEVDEDIKLSLNYTPQQAFHHVRTLYPDGQVITIRERSNVNIKDILDLVQVEPPMVISCGDAFPPPVVPEPPSKTPAQFVYEMLLLADKFIPTKRDQTIVKNILKKINVITYGTGTTGSEAGS